MHTRPKAVLYAMFLPHPSTFCGQCPQNGWTDSHARMKNRSGLMAGSRLEAQEARAKQHPYQGHGCWAGLEVLALQQHSGWAFTLDATPSSYDQMWIFGLCAHTVSLGQLRRLGAITKVRALLGGLVAWAKHTEEQVKVIVQLATVWEAWHQTKSRGPFQDILDELVSRLQPSNSLVHQQKHQNTGCSWKRTSTSSPPTRFGPGSLGTSQDTSRCPTRGMARNPGSRPQVDLSACSAKA